MGTGMKLYKVRAIVLSSRKMRDAHRILTLFSREHGKIRAVAHGVAKPTSRKRGAVQPFCHSLFMLRRGRELDSVDQCEGQEIFPALWSDLDRMTWAGYATELVESLTVEGEPNQAVFHLLLQTLGLLETTAQLELVARGFELKLLTILGYRPHLDTCVNCNEDLKSGRTIFSPAAGGLVCSSCATPEGGVPSGGETVAVMRVLLHWDLNKIERLHVSDTARREMKTALERYVQWYLEGRLRTLRFMEQVRHGGPNTS